MASERTLRKRIEARRTWTLTVVGADCVARKVPYNIAAAVTNAAKRGEVITVRKRKAKEAS